MRRKILEATEGIFDKVSLFVGLPVEAERLLPVRLVGNDRLGTTLVQP
jgi:hypothetical protein